MQSEMAVTCAVLGDSEVKPICESRLAAAMSLGWLLLVLGLRALSKRYRGVGLSQVGCCLFDRIYDVVRHEPRPAIHMEKQLG